MPLVDFWYDPRALGFLDSDGVLCGDWERKLSTVTSQIPYIVAKELHVDHPKEGHLTGIDVGVWTHPKQAGDISLYPVMLKISANLYPLRLVDIKDRTDRLRTSLSDLLNQEFPKNWPRKFAVWVTLGEAGFAEGTFGQ